MTHFIETALLEVIRCNRADILHALIVHELGKKKQAKILITAMFAID
jgi:hypothetical protein